MEKLDGQVPTHGRLTGKGIMRTTGLVEVERRARGCTVNPADAQTLRTHEGGCKVQRRARVFLNDFSGGATQHQLGAEAHTVNDGEHDGEDNKGFHLRRRGWRRRARSGRCRRNYSLTPTGEKTASRKGPHGGEL